MFGLACVLICLAATSSQATRNSVINDSVGNCQTLPPKTFTIGLLDPIHRQMTAAAALVAVDEINKSKILEELTIRILWRDSDCDPGQALRGMSELLKEGVDIILGPTCSIACEPTQYLASALNMPQVEIIYFSERLPNIQHTSDFSFMHIRDPFRQVSFPHFLASGWSIFSSWACICFDV